MPKQSNRIMSVSEALREALDICLERDPRVYVMGEGVADPKAIFDTTKGLAQKYGPERVFEMPVAENGMTGVAIGSALLGRRPVLIHQRVDFALLSLEQLFDNAAKFYYVSGGKHTVPMVVRMIVGRGWGQGPAHSQSLEALFAHIPGLKVIMPSSPKESKGMLIAAIEDPNPVMVIEHRWIHYVSGEVPAGYYTTPLDGPHRVTEGNDLTIVANSYMRYEANAAVDILREFGVGVELIDLAVVRPLNMEPILQSVRRTGRLIAVDTGWSQFGIGAEVVARALEGAFPSFKAAPRRFGLGDHPTPSSRELAKVYYPTALTIALGVSDMLGLAADKRAAIRSRVIEVRGEVPPDVPNPAFRGPF